MHNLTPLSGLFGGALIGLAAAMLMAADRPACRRQRHSRRIAAGEARRSGLADRFRRGADRGAADCGAGGRSAAAACDDRALRWSRSRACWSASAPAWAMAAPPATASAASRAFRRARLRQRSIFMVTAIAHGRASAPRVWRLGDAGRSRQLCCGLIFGAGLLISGMTEPEKVIGFLDIFGAWDATLAFVMAGAVAVAAIGFALARRRTRPVFSADVLWPTAATSMRRWSRARRCSASAGAWSASVPAGAGQRRGIELRIVALSPRCCSAWSAMILAPARRRVRRDRGLLRFLLVQTGEP